MPGAILDARRLIAAAQEDVGLDDLHDDALPARLELLTGQIEGRLDTLGQVRAAAVIRGLLAERLQFFEARRRHPIPEERIGRPIIAMGEGRCGTTVLQMLLGCDPSARLLEFWEVMRPPPPLGAGDMRRRRIAGDADWREILDQIPRWLTSHPYNAMLGRNPPECERTWAMDFRTTPPTAWWRVPMVPLLAPQIRLPSDFPRQYEIHRMLLQHLQFGREPRRWVLKGVTHQQRLEALLEAYPDAVFIWIHRDPIQATASRLELHAQIYEGIAPQAMDRTAFAKATVDICLKNFAHSARDPYADDPRIHHLRYKNFTADPIAAIRAIYASAGLPFTAAFEREMRRWMADNKPDRFGTFTYSERALGVDLDWLESEVAPYRARFDIPVEKERQPHGLR